MDASREPYGVAPAGLSDGSHDSVSQTPRLLPRTGPALRPLARSIAEAHGGRLELASEPGNGTRAVLVLPRSGPLNERASGGDDARAA